MKTFSRRATPSFILLDRLDVAEIPRTRRSLVLYLVLYLELIRNTRILIRFPLEISELSEIPSQKRDEAPTKEDVQLIGLAGVVISYDLSAPAIKETVGEARENSISPAFLPSAHFITHPIQILTSLLFGTRRP